MTEALLQYIWEFQLFDFKNLFSTNGEKISIIHPGKKNTNAGPDFSNAKIRVNDIVLVGNIEIHIYASDFIKHQHQTDKNYNNLILHVVLVNDVVLNINCSTLSLKGLIPLEIQKKYENLISSNDAIACKNLLLVNNNINWQLELDRYSIERLERKTEMLQLFLVENNYHWETTFYWLLAKNFGLNVNAEAFLQLAKQTPLTILAKHKNSLHQIESIIFGQSGLLDEVYEDAYLIRIQAEYQFLKTKYQLIPIDKIYWKKSKMRPQNFPFIRLAQFAQIIFHSNHLLSKIIDCESLLEAKKMFQISASEYWNNHYSAEVISGKKSKNLGTSTIYNIIINTAIPVLFAYGKAIDKDVICDKALHWLDEIIPEKNKITDFWSELNVRPINAFESQALIELYNEYCVKKNCLKCSIGNRLLK